MSSLIDTKVFAEHLQRLTESIKDNGDTQWSGADALSICVGKVTGDEITSSPTLALMIHLVDMVFSDTLFVVSPTTLYVLASASKIKKYFTPLAAQAEEIKCPVKISLHTRDKVKGDAAEFAAILAAVSDGSPRIAALNGEFDASKVLTGPFATAWTAAMGENGATVVNGTGAVSQLLTVKTQTELKYVHRAAVLSSRILRNGYVPRIETMLQDDRTKSCSKVSAAIEAELRDPAKFSVKVAPETLEWTFPPQIQVGEQPSFSVSAESPAANATGHTMYCALSVRHHHYSALCTRTLFLDPTDEEKNLYETLLHALDVGLHAIQPETSASVAYKAVLDAVKEKNPELLPYLSKSMGHSIGIQFNEGFELDAGNDLPFRDGMAVVVSLHFRNVPLKTEGEGKPKTFSARVAETVLVGSHANRHAERGVVEWTRSMSRAWNVVAMFLDEEEEEDDAAVAKAIAEQEEATGPRRRTRGQEHAKEVAAKLKEAQEREQNQVSLIQQLIDKRRKGVGIEEEDEGEEENTLEDVKSYKHAREYPRSILRNNVSVDKEREVVFIPVNGTCIPFHITTIKTVAINSNDDETSLRFNFYTPGSFPKDAPKRQVASCERHGADRVFFKSITVRSRAGRNLHTQVREIKLLQKQRREQIRINEDQKGLVDQPDLQLSSSNPIRLQGVSMWPRMGRNKQGALQVHKNGLRYRNSQGQHVDIIFRNIRHMIFQESKGNQHVVLHFNLKHPIMIGKRKYRDIQFYSDVGVGAEGIDDAKRSMYDVDEVEQEDRERLARQKLDRAFRDFGIKIQKTVVARERITLNLDIPYKDMNFMGKHARERVALHITEQCIISVMEWPPLVVSMEDVEHVHLERITFTAREFDMVLIMKDYTKPVQKIETIPAEKRQLLEEWFNREGKSMTRSLGSFNWTGLMAAARTPEFWLDVDEDGNPTRPGWLKLEEGAAAGDEEQGDGDESESNYSDEASDFEGEEGVPEEDDDEFEEAVDDEDEEEEEEDYESESEGEGWDELAKKAAAEDAAKGDAPSSRKRGRA